MDELLKMTAATKKGERPQFALRPSLPSLPDGGEAHLYSIFLDRAPGEMVEIKEWLSPEEKARAEKFRFDLHRNRFIAGRAALRQLLSAYVGAPPESLCFVYWQNGKPELQQVQADVPLTFNLAHSDNLGLIGLSRSAAIGVDLERVRFLDDFDELVRRFFSPAETRAFLGLSFSEKPQAFFNLWTRKEAWLKATGEGIAYSLNQVEVSFSPEDTAVIRRLPAGNGEVEDWSLEAISVSPGFAAAVVTHSPHFHARFLNWPDHTFSFSAPHQNTQTQLS